MSHPQTSPDTLSTTSSPELAAGPSPSDSLECPTTTPSGPVPARANLSARQAKALGLLMSGTSGPLTTISSKSAALQESLVNKLRARTQMLGSTLWKLTWKPWVMPSGRSRFRLRASVRPTSETDTTGWPTPTTRDHKDGFYCPNVPINALLGRAVWAAGWPTPMAGDEKWRYSTTDSAERRLASGKQMPLEAWVMLMGPVRLTATGQTLTGSDARIESGGQLNPEHSRWLMAYPKEWCACAATATQSTSAPPSNSSTP